MYATFTYLPTYLLACLLVLSGFRLVHSQPSTDYRLVFIEDFNTQELDNSKWNMSSCFTLEDSPFVTTNSQNYLITPNGNPSVLSLLANREEFICGNNEFEYTISLLNNVDYLYGYFEIRAWVPGACGAWPAFWFWSGTNDTQASEVDVIESCGLCCSKYQFGFFNDATNDNIAQTTEHIKSEICQSSICSDYKLYGFEWTPSQLSFYYNGVLVFSRPNIYTHQPLALLLGLGLGDFLCNCLENNCLNSAEFPYYFNIDWVKIYKKEGTALELKPESTSLCIGEEINFYIPIYGSIHDYQFTIEPVNSLNITKKIEFCSINASTMPGFQGSWKQVAVEGISPGFNSIKVGYLFPDGYFEEKTLSLTVYADVPQVQSFIEFSTITNPQCCYQFYTNLNPTATSYSWIVKELSLPPIVRSYLTNTNVLDIACIDEGEYSVTVIANNSCGSSDPLVRAFEFLNPPCY